MFIDPIVMIGNVNVLRVMRLALCGKVYRLGNILLVSVWSTVTIGIGRWELKLHSVYEPS